MGKRKDTMHSDRNDYRGGDKTSEISWKSEWTKNMLINEIFYFDI